jgi:hypothetical protein
MTPSVKNVSLSDFKRFLTHHGLANIRTSGGHEVWSDPGLTRPVIIKTHIDPIPVFVIKNNLRTMGLKLNDLNKFLETKSN